MPSPDSVIHYKEIKNIIFDLDGTLIDSAPSILGAFEQTLTQFAYKPIKALEPSLIGPPLKKTLEEISGESDPAKLAMLVDGFKQSYDNEAYALSTSYAGVNEMLASLALAGKRLHIATNKRLIPTQKIIQLFEWEKYFQSVYAIDKVAPAYLNKSYMLKSMRADLKLQSERCLYVGDRLEDDEAARENAMPFVYVNWGYGPSDEKIQHLQVANDPNELFLFLHGQ